MATGDHDGGDAGVVEGAYRRQRLLLEPVLQHQQADEFHVGLDVVAVEFAHVRPRQVRRQVLHGQRQHSVALNIPFFVVFFSKRKPGLPFRFSTKPLPVDDGWI